MSLYVSDVAISSNLSYIYLKLANVSWFLAILSGFVSLLFSNLRIFSSIKYPILFMSTVAPSTVSSLTYCLCFSTSVPNSKFSTVMMIFSCNKFLLFSSPTNFTSKRVKKESLTSEKSEFEFDHSLWVHGITLFQVLVEKLVKTRLAVGKQSLSEIGKLHSIQFGFITSQVKFKSDQFFAEVSVKSAVIVLVLGLVKDSFNDKVHFTLNCLIIFNFINNWIIPFFQGKLFTSKNVLSQLSEFFVKIIRSDQIADQSNLLLSIFVRSGFFNCHFTFFGQFLLHFIGFLSLERIHLYRLLFSSFRFKLASSKIVISLFIWSSTAPSALVGSLTLLLERSLF